MSKGTEWPSGTTATLLHIITLSGFIDLLNEKSTRDTLDYSLTQTYSETDKPLDEIVALFWCDNTDNPQLPHIYWDPPIPHSVSQQDMVMLCRKNMQ